jgi:hypothetical protein|tara:strand:+ start:488 stop:1300 length:813 start_codon:yes stop_codon:yes gene_type:complete
MDLVVFGDSWTHGDELKYDNSEYRNTYNIGGLVYKDFKFKNYHNYSSNGGSLQHIIFHIINYLNSEHYHKDNLVLVGLTSPMRKFRFNNIIKRVTNWTSLDYDENMEFADDVLKNSKVFKDWWKGDVISHVNIKNDLVHYFNMCVIIKQLLSKHKKYIVWQSIDGGLYEDVEKDIQGVVIDYENQNSKEIERQGEDNSIFDKKFVDKFLKQDCTETQLWLNIDNSTWHDWLRLRETGLVESQMHPSEEGIKLWYDNFLQKYLRKILDNSK